MLVLFWLLPRAVGFWLRGPAVDAWLVVGVGSDIVFVVAMFKTASPSRIPRLLLAIAAFLRVVDLAHVAIERTHFTVSSWAHVSPDLWRLALEGSAVLVLSCALAAAWFAWRASGFSAHATPPRTRVWQAVAVVVVAGHWIAFPNAMHNGLLPEVNALRTLQVWFTGPASLGLQPLVGAERARCGDMFAVGATPTRAALLSTGATETAAQNVVVIFIESLDKRWLDRTAGADKALRDRGFVSFSGYYTQARPTQFGLVASLCGLLPGTWPFATRADRKVPPRACLGGHLQRTVGMKPVFIHGGYNSYTGLGTTLRQLGFAHVIGRRELDPRGETPTNNPFGLHDRDVYRGALDVLLETIVTRERRFIAIATADSHFPGYVRSEDRAQLDQADRMAVATKTALHEALEWIDKLAGTGLLSRTLVVITADHSAHATDGERLFGELMLAIRRPNAVVGEARATFGGQLDLAATILDVLQLPPRPDLFAGRSLWSDRPRNAALWAMSGSRVAQIRRDGEVVFPTAQLEGMCRAVGDCRVIRCLNHLDGYWYRRHAL